MRFVYRALTPAQEDAVRKAVGAGADRHALADAYGVSKRTIDRTISERGGERTFDIEIDGYRATFVVDELGPKQRTDWRAA